MMRLPTMFNRQLASGVLVALGLAGSVAIAGIAHDRFAPLRPLDPTDRRTTLRHVEAAVAMRYQVGEVTTHDVEDLLDEARTVLFDVRTVAEYEAGHLPGAVRVDPGIATDAFLRAHAARMHGKIAVFYCAVGVRSSELARRVAHGPGVPTVGQFNLRGGAFRWVVSGRDLVSGAEPGNLHPYNAQWEKLLVRTRSTQ